MDDEDDDDYEDEMTDTSHADAKPAALSRKTKQNVYSIPGGQKSLQVMLVEPVNYADSQIIADHLKNQRSVVINLHLMSETQSRRILDFLSGHIYAINGDIQRIGSNIFICTPDCVEITGAISAFENEQDDENGRWQ